MGSPEVLTIAENVRRACIAAARAAYEDAGFAGWLEKPIHVSTFPERVRRSLRLPGLALRGWVVAGVDPRTPGLGPVPAVQRLLAVTGTSLDDVGVLEGKPGGGPASHAGADQQEGGHAAVH